MITYQVYKTVISVFLDGKKVDAILHKSQGYCYFPSGSKEHGEFFDDLDDCKASLQDDI